MIELKTIGERIQYIRFLSKLSRKDVEDKYSISRHVLRSWEDNKKTINDDELKLIIDVFANMGIDIDIKWIKTGLGNYEISKDISDRKFTHLDILSEEVKKFLAFINSKGITNYISNNWNDYFKPINKVNGNIIKILGEKIKPHIEEILNGKASIFRYISIDNEYIDLRLVPCISKEKVFGFYIFAI